jgi:adenine-specific DNA-methyltransferase
MASLIEDGRIMWPSDPSGRPRLKRYQNEVADEFTGLSTVLNTVYNTQGTRELSALFDDQQVMDFPKPSEYIRLLCQQGAPSDGEEIVIDFFAGSCTTAQAVLELNREEGGNRRFIMVQLPEPTGREDFPTIADIGKERIRRVVARMKNADTDKLDLPEREAPEDLGFRVFKLAPSTYRNWAGVDAADDADLPDRYAAQMALHADGLVDGWQPQGVIAEVALKEAGFGLGYAVETLAESLWRVTEPDTGRFFFISLADDLDLDDVAPLGLDKETLFVCRATALDDTTAGNLQLQCRLKVV